MTCPHCAGGEVDAVLDTGEGPFYDCFACKGSGKLSFLRHLRLRKYLKDFKRVMKPTGKCGC